VRMIASAASAAVAMLFAATAPAQDAGGIAPFSRAIAGAPLPVGWREQPIPRAAPSKLDLVADAGVTVLRVASLRAAGGATFALEPPAPDARRIHWRWKVDRVVAAGALGTKAGDDFAARVYVFFGIPLAALPWTERVRIRFARLVFGERLPTAALCYVWDNRHPVGTSDWNPYTNRVRMVVLQSGPAHVGEWTAESRDLERDFRAAFGSQWRGPMPPVTGIAAGNDTDQTGEGATAWFGDFRLERSP
jgi:hypothetical protein